MKAVQQPIRQWRSKRCWPRLIAVAKVDFSKFGEIEEVELSRINKISAGANLHRNWVIPHVTHLCFVQISLI